MLIVNSPETRSAIRRAVELLDAVDTNALVEITTHANHLYAVVVVDAHGRYPDGPDEVIAASFPTSPQGPGIRGAA